jgi:hypothetical protein
VLAEWLQGFYDAANSGLVPIQITQFTEGLFMNVDLAELWLPILISGIVLFIASWAAWMLLPHHRSDYAPLPDEQRLAETLRGMNIQPGQYMFPYCQHGEQNSEEFKRKMEQGPSGTMIVRPNSFSMGANLVCTFLLFLVLSFCIAYLATIALPKGESFMNVLRFVGTAGILTYAAGENLNAIWFKRKVRTNVLDGIAYGLLTGVIFGLMWPGAAA